MANAKIYGVDVAHWQGQPNWAAVKASGRSFAFIKATEGAKATDPQYARNRAACLSTGVLVGSYHFYRYQEDWAEQAHHFVTTVGHLQPGELPPVIDLEDRQGIQNIGTATGMRKVLAFVEAVGAKLERRMIVYADRDFVLNYLQSEELGNQTELWLAAYRATAPNVLAPWKSLAFWQSSEHALVPGIEGDCDSDVYLGGDMASLLKMAGK